MKSNNFMCSYVGPEYSWKLLGAAIVKQAVIDWKESKMLLSKPDTMTAERLKLFRESERFLRSPQVEFYSQCDGPTLLRKLKDGEI